MNERVSWPIRWAGYHLLEEEEKKALTSKCSPLNLLVFCPVRVG